MKLIEKKISIIMCCKNNANYINGVVDSINKQNYKNLELIICLKNKINQKLPHLNNSNFKEKIFLQRGNGLYSAINQSIKKSTGKIIFIHHPDNLIIDKRLFNKVNEVFVSKKIDLFYSNLYIVDSSNVNKITRRWSSPIFKKKLLDFGWAPPHPTLFYSSTIAKKFKYNERYKISSDYDLMIRVLRKINPKQIFRYNKFTIAMRDNGLSDHPKHIFLKTYEDYKILRNNNYRFPGIILLIKIIKKIKQLF